MRAAAIGRRVSGSALVRCDGEPAAAPADLPCIPSASRRPSSRRRPRPWRRRTRSRTPPCRAARRRRPMRRRSTPSPRCPRRACRKPAPRRATPRSPPPVGAASSGRPAAGCCRASGSSAGGQRNDGVDIAAAAETPGAGRRGGRRGLRRRPGAGLRQPSADQARRRLGHGLCPPVQDRGQDQGPRRPGRRRSARSGPPAGSTSRSCTSRCAMRLRRANAPVRSIRRWFCPVSRREGRFRGAKGRGFALTRPESARINRASVGPAVSLRV